MSRHWLFVLVFGCVVALSLAVADFFVPGYHSIAAFRIQPVRVDDNNLRATYAIPQRAPITGNFLLYIPVHSGQLGIQINGHDFGQTGLNDAARISRRKLPTALQIAPKFLDSGSPNTITITQLDGKVTTPPSPVYWGPASQIEPVLDAHFAIGPAMRASVPALATTLVFITLAMAFLSRSPARYLCMTGMFALQVAIELDDQITWGHFSLRAIAPFLSLFRDLALFYCFNLWFDGRASHRRFALWAVAISAGILLAVTITNGLATKATFLLFSIRTLAVCAYCGYAILHSERVKADSQRIALALFAAFMTSNLVYLIFYQPSGRAEVDFLAANYVNVSMVIALGLLVFGAMSLEWNQYRNALVDRNALGVIMSGNRLELDQRTRELQTEIEKRAVLEERERFTRDLHDGISGQLLSLLLQARKGKLDPAEVERGVSQSLADLRLVTASIDTADEGFVASLRSFRERAAQQLSVAGITLDWHEGRQLESITLTSQTTLDVMRIMQEAVTNIIRHAGADTTSVSIDEATSGTLTISITDNGCGFAATTDKHGNGLKNMRHRVERNHGTLTIAPGDKGRGTSLILSLPAFVPISRSG